MKKEGYVIARGSHKQYFSAQSAYDRSEWKSLSEATVYPNSDLAANAAKKLWMNYIYDAKVVPLSEYAEEECEAMAPAAAEESEMSVNASKFHKGDSVMCGDEACTVVKALPNSQVVTVATDMNDPSTYRDVNVGELNSAQEEEGIDMAGRMRSGEQQWRENPLAGSHWWVKTQSGKKWGPFADDKRAAVVLAGRNDLQQAGGKVVREEALPGDEIEMISESVTDPTPPALDAKPSENKNTVLDLPKPDKLELENPAVVADDEDTALTKATAEDHEEKVTVPSEVKNAIKNMIADFNSRAEFSNGKNDVAASQEMTIRDAMQDLLDLLEIGTVESLKRAQVFYSTFMSPITNNVPDVVKKFVLLGGRKPMTELKLNLKEKFYDRWDADRVKKD